MKISIYKEQKELIWKGNKLYHKDELVAEISNDLSVILSPIMKTKKYSTYEEAVKAAENFHK